MLILRELHAVLQPREVAEGAGDEHEIDDACDEQVLLEIIPALAAAQLGVPRGREQIERGFRARQHAERMHGFSKLLRERFGEPGGFLGGADLGKIGGHALQFRGKQEAGQLGEHGIGTDAGDGLRPGELAVGDDGARGLFLLGPEREDGPGVRAGCRDAQGLERDARGDAALFAQRRAQRIELDAGCGEGDHRALALILREHLEAVAHVFDRVRQRFFELELEHLGQLRVVGGGELVPLDEHGLARQRELDIRIRRQRRDRVPERGDALLRATADAHAPAVGIRSEERCGCAVLLHLKNGIGLPAKYAKGRKKKGF